LGIDDQDMIAASNRRADALFRRNPGDSLLGSLASDCLPGTLLQKLQNTLSTSNEDFDGGLIQLADDVTLQVWISPMGEASRSKGKILVFMPFKAD
jgi:hypothetical protein